VGDLLSFRLGKEAETLTVSKGSEQENFDLELGESSWLPCVYLGSVSDRVDLLG
jgi:hypothetical protein